jgi:P4 family phage/plasmid primase-like protien
MTNGTEALADIDASALEFARHLELLGRHPDQLITVSTKLPDGPFIPDWMTVREAAALHLLQDRDTWYSTQALTPDARTRGGRGKAADIDQIVELTADLDDKDTGTGSAEASRAIGEDVAAVLGVQPVSWVHTGHGLQPHWRVAPDGVRRTNADLIALYRRWGRLVAMVAEEHGAKVDGVFDLARVMRVPGTMNVGKGEPVPAWFEEGDPDDHLTLIDLEDTLTRYGIAELASDRNTDDRRDVAAAPGDWKFGTVTARNVDGMIHGWATEIPGTTNRQNGRNPWCFAQFHRLHSAHRLGAITEADYVVARATLVRRFTALCLDGIGGPARKVQPGEITGMDTRGRDNVARKTEAECAKEIGGMPSPTDPFAKNSTAIPAPRTAADRAMAGEVVGHRGTSDPVDAPQTAEDRDVDEDQDDGEIVEPCDRWVMMAGATPQPTEAGRAVWQLLASDTDVRIGPGRRDDRPKVFALVSGYREYELTTQAGIDRLAAAIVLEHPELIGLDGHPLNNARVEDICTYYAQAMIGWRNCVVSNTPAGGGPDAEDGGSPWFGPDGLKVADCAAHVLATQPCARTREAKIAVYRNGVYGIDGGALRIVITGMLDNRWTVTHDSNIEAFTASELKRLGHELPDTLDEPLLNFTNGLLDLRTLELRPHTPDVFTTWQLGFDWNPDATCPTYLFWADLVNILDQLDKLEETAGTMLDRSRVPTRAMFLFGPSKSGKSTYLRLMEAVAGTAYVSGVSLHDLCTNPFMAANLFGKVLNSCADLAATDIEDISIFKKMTGDDLITGNRKYGKLFDFRNNALFAFSANDPPTVVEASRAYLERIDPFKFGMSFAGAEDASIEAAMKTELPGIVARWAKAYNKRLIRGRPLPTSPAVAAEFAQSSNRVALWMSKEVVIDPTSFITTNDLHAAFSRWCDAERGAKAMGRTKFAKQLTALELPARRHPGSDTRGWAARVNPFAG